MYKNKGKQREAVKKAVQKHRGITQGITQGITKGVIELRFSKAKQAKGLMR